MNPVKEPIKKSDIQEVLTQLAVLNANFSSLVKELSEVKAGVEKANDDHETRLRVVEAQKIEIASINERMKTFNLAQGTLTALAAIITYWFARN